MRRPSGFTLIELMVVVAIIGVLSSIAIPSFRNMQLRSRQSERKIMMRSISDALAEYWVREGRYPTGDESFNYFIGSYNPAYPPTGQKRPWRRNDATWNRLSLLVDGNLYYSYYAIHYAWTGGYHYRYLETQGDLDDSGAPYNQYYTYRYEYPVDGSPYRYDYVYDDGPSVGF